MIKISNGAEAREWREKLGWTVEQLASAACLHRVEVREAEALGLVGWPKSDIYAPAITAALTAEYQRQAREALEQITPAEDGVRFYPFPAQDIVDRLFPALHKRWASAGWKAARLASFEPILASLREAAGEPAQETSPGIHDLKTWIEYFGAVADGSKTFEARKDDRGYAVGDVLTLREWDRVARTYTGRVITRCVTYVLRGPGFGVEAGHVVMGLGEPVQPAPPLTEPVAPEGVTVRDAHVHFGGHYGFTVSIGASGNMPAYFTPERLRFLADLSDYRRAKAAQDDAQRKLAAVEEAQRAYEEALNKVAAATRAKFDAEDEHARAVRAGIEAENALIAAKEAAR